MTEMEACGEVHEDKMKENMERACCSLGCGMNDTRGVDGWPVLLGGDSAPPSRSLMLSLSLSGSGNHDSASLQASAVDLACPPECSAALNL